jgi:hypothetical protein
MRRINQRVVARAIKKVGGTAVRRFHLESDSGRLKRLFEGDV